MQGKRESRANAQPRDGKQDCPFQDGSGVVCVVHTLGSGFWKRKVASSIPGSSRSVEVSLSKAPHPDCSRIKVCALNVNVQYKWNRSKDELI